MTSCPFRRGVFVRAGAVIAACSASAKAQTQPIVSLPWDVPFFSAGPRAQDYPPAQDNLDVWVVEDFVTDRPWRIGTFQSSGSGIGGASDVIAVILDDLPGPGGGREVMRSTPGSGRFVSPPPPQVWGHYETDFDGQVLPAGSYWVMWQVQGGSNIVPVMFVQAGDYAVGVGTTNTSYQFNPGGGWNMPQGVLDPITDGLNHTGVPIGVNFTLRGELAPTCDPVDFNRDGLFPDVLDIEDFLSVMQGGACSNDPDCGDIDFNNDGLFPDVLDVQNLLDVFAGSDCP